MGARMYDPELGRFISPDSIVPDFSNPQSLNRYSYVLNNALKYTDPTGHRWVKYSAGEVIDERTINTQYADEWDTAKQARNTAIFETAMAVGDTLLAMANEPYDWISTASRCTQGECNWLDYTAMVLPLVPSAIGKMDEVGFIYKKATGSFDSLTPRPGIDDLNLETGGLSFFDSLENMSQAMPFKHGDKYVTVDPQKLNGLDVIFDNVPPGHVTVRPPTLEALREWAATKGTGVAHKFTEIIRNAYAVDPQKWK